MKLIVAHIVVLILLVVSGNLAAQQLPDALQGILKADTAFSSFSCKINVQVEVPGLNMPDKEIYLELDKGKKPKIKGKGLLILPKHGIIGQYREILGQSVQAIPMGENGDTLLYKIVSLDKKTDWVTVDLSLTPADNRVHHMSIATRKNGEFEVDHFYEKPGDIFPQKTVIRFEAMPLKLPLKFMGQQYTDDEQLQGNDPVSGRVVLNYSEINVK